MGGGLGIIRADAEATKSVTAADTSGVLFFTSSLFAKSVKSFCTVGSVMFLPTTRLRTGAVFGTPAASSISLVTIVGAATPRAVSEDTSTPSSNGLGSANISNCLCDWGSSASTSRRSASVKGVNAATLGAVCPDTSTPLSNGLTLAADARSIVGISSCPSSPLPVRSKRSLLSLAFSARSCSCGVSSGGVVEADTLRSGIKLSSSDTPARCSASFLASSAAAVSACSASLVVMACCIPNARSIVLSSDSVGVVFAKPWRCSSALNARAKL